jgi:hypothetical protein
MRNDPPLKNVYRKRKEINVTFIGTCAECEYSYAMSPQEFTRCECLCPDKQSQGITIINNYEVYTCEHFKLKV